LIGGRVVCYGAASRYLGMLAAAMLRARNHRGDQAKAASLLREALVTVWELGMHALEARITAGEAAQPPLPALFDIDDLSAREVEVLRLIAAGKSNQDIADALHISLNTVATHVRNSLAKTGSTNRTEAAAYAMRCGIVSETE
jgi:DNA-binding CsgD family transcriptional regulator